MKILMYSIILTFLYSQTACVGAGVYKAEKKNRVAAETREKVLVNELLDRKKETKDLTILVGDLNKSLGRQEVEMKNLQSELVARTQSMGESASKLSSEKASLDRQLAASNEQLGKKSEQVQRVKSVQDKQKAVLADLETALKKSFQSQLESGVSVLPDAGSVWLTFPDKLLFDSQTGMTIVASGKDLLTKLAEFLAARPSLDVDVVAYTDNVLPAKDKTLKDTWDWSLQRATTVVRTLIRDYNVNANQLTAVGRGEFYPVTSNETPEGRSKNRRTVIVIKPVLPAIPGIE